MINVNSAFKTAMTQSVKEVRASVSFEDTTVTSSDDLVSIKMSREGGLLKTVMGKVEVRYSGPSNPLAKAMTVKMMVRLGDGTFSEANYGAFNCTEVTHNKDQEYSTAIGYDNMLKFYVAYAPIFTYPTTLLAFTTAICDQCGVELGNTTLPSGDFVITSEHFENIADLTYVTVLRKIAEMTGTTAIIGADGKLYFRAPSATGEQITYSNLFKLKLEPNYGPVNSVVLSRQPQEDNVVLKDDDDIATYGLTEIKIANNEFIDGNREGFITTLYDRLYGVIYTPFEAETEGLGWYEVMDRVTLVNQLGELFSTIILGITLTIDGSGIQERLVAKATPRETTKYQYAGGLTTRQKNTEIIVNKQGGDIDLLAQTTAEQDGRIQENTANINVNAQSITQEVIDREESNGQIVNELSSLVTQVSDSFTLEFRRIDSSVDAVSSDLSTITTTYQVTADGALIGKDGSPLQISISNQELNFLDGGSVIAYINGRKMYIESLEILQSIILGYHKIEKYDGLHKATTFTMTGG